MKKFLVLTAAALTFVGCSDFTEQDALPTTEIDAPETIHASFENVAEESRTYLDEGRYMRWTENDEISYFPGITYNMQYRFAGSTGERNGSFNKLTFDPVTGADLNCNYAVYPYAEATSISTNGVISFNLPATQTYVENSFGLGANTMVAATQNIDDKLLSFKNVCGYLKLQLYGENTTVKSIEFRGNDNEKIAGAATITASYDSNPTVSMTESATTSITLDCIEGVKLSTDSANPTAFWLVIPEQTFENGFTITVTDTNGGKFEKATQNSVAITRNTIQPMKAAKAECKVSVPKPANNEIWYTNGSTTEATAPYKTDVFGANIVSNLYDADKMCWVITFDGDVTEIGKEAFYSYNTDCKKITSITIPDSVTSIGNYAFYYCTSLTNVTIPDSVTSIGERAFRHCESLTNVTIPDSLTSIGHVAFEYCTSLTSVTIGKSVTSIGNYAFRYCTSLKRVDITDLSAWCKISFNSSSNPLCNGAKLYINNTEATDIIIPSDITEIKNYAFYGCSSLTTITIPDSVTEIGQQAFSNCTSLTSVTIGKRVTSIGNFAFYYCTSLTSVTIPDSVTSIGGGAFSDCTSLTSVTIPDSVTYFGIQAFDGCSSLTSVTIPDSVTSIGTYAFLDCTSLTNVTIGKSVTSIGSYAFYKCTSLTRVDITDLSTWCKIGFDNSSSNPLCNGAKLYINNTEAADITIPSDITEIKNYAFYGYSSLTSVNIGNGVTSIGEVAFADCSSLTSVTIPDSVTSIRNSAFYGCTSLTSITIPDSVTSIEGGAFDSCTSLTSVTIPDSVTSIGYAAFEDCSSLASITIPDSVTSIGGGAFDSCTSLTSVTIGNGVTSIGGGAFDSCTSLTSVTIPDSVTSIGDYAFRDCTSLTSVNIPDSVTSIGDQAFLGCTSLTSVTIPDSVTEIGEDAFWACTSLKEVYCKVTTPPTGGLDMFSYYNSGYKPIGCKIYVPASSDDSIINAYKMADGWSDYASYIEEYDFSAEQ